MRSAWFVPLVLILAGIAPYANSLWGEFHFDDSNQITDRSDLGQLSVLLRNVPRGRALTFTTYALNYRLHGLEWMPGWHMVNIALHAGCVLALYWMLRLLLGSDRLGLGGAGASRGKAAGGRGRGAAKSRSSAARVAATSPEAGSAAIVAAFIGALVFAVHPLASEPVNYIQARAVILYTLFTLLACCGVLLACSGIAAVRDPREESRRQSQGRIIGGAVLAFGSILLATVSKEVGIFFALACPLTLVALWSLPMVRQRPRWLLVAAGVGLAIVAAAGFWAHTSGMWSAMDRRLSAEFFWAHIRGQLLVFWRYLLLAFLPLPSLLSMDHYVPVRDYALSDGDVMAALLGLVGLVLLPAALLARVRPKVAFLLLLLPLGLAPYFVMTSSEMMVEYRFYLPLAAFCGLVGMGIAGLLRRHGGGMQWGTAGLVLLLAIMTAERNTAWRTDVSIWTDACEKAPRKARTVNGLAWALLRDKTAPDPRRALRLAQDSFDPRRVDVLPWYNPFMVDTLAETYFANGMVQKAIELERDIMYRHGWSGDAWFRKQLAKFEAAASRPAASNAR